MPLVRKYRTGQLTDEIADAHRIAEYEGKTAELERKVGQLTIEIDLVKKRARLARWPRGANCSIVSYPKVSPSRGCRTMKVALLTYYIGIMEMT